MADVTQSKGVTIRFTGLDRLEENFAKAPSLVEAAVHKALGLSLAEVEHQVKQRTPVLTGILQGSIGGAGGYSYIRGLSAGIGTNIVYAYRQEVEDSYHHKTGEAHYAEHGAQAAGSFITKKFEAAMEEVAKGLVE